MNHVSLKDILQVFLKLGVTGFGGPAAHIAMMRKEVVEKRAWMTDREFIDLLGATHLIPGPNSTELAIHLGHSKGGWKGLLVAGSSFIFPAFISVLAVAVLYSEYGTLPQVEPILHGIRPVIVAIVLEALWKFRKSAIPDWPTALIAIVSLILSYLGVNEVTIILGVSLAYALGKNVLTATAPMIVLTTIPVLLPRAISHISGSSIFWFFCKIGSVLFGSGYVLLAFLQEELVKDRMWLTEKQLLDAVTVGQVTPGPVFTTATFIGFLLKSYEGAILATLGIFLPSFFFVAVSAPFIPRLRNSRFFSAFLDAINAASLALLVKVSIELGQQALLDFPTVLIGVLSMFLILKFKNLNSVWAVLCAGILGGFFF